MIIFHGDFQIVWKIYVPSTLDLKGKKAGYLFILSLCTTIKITIQGKVHIQIWVLLSHKEVSVKELR